MGSKGHARNVCVCVSLLIYDVWGLSSPAQSCVAVYEIKKKLLYLLEELNTVEMTA